MIRILVGSRAASRVTRYVEKAVAASIENSLDFRAMIHEGLMESGGPLTSEEREWAKRVLTPEKPAKTTKPRKAA